jgi:hypothetical protein
MGARKMTAEEGLIMRVLTDLQGRKGLLAGVNEYTLNVIACDVAAKLTEVERVNCVAEYIKKYKNGA